MKLLVLLLAGAAAPAMAQAPDPHAHHRPAEPAPAADPHAGHAMPQAPAADPHAHHHTPAPQSADPHAGHAAPSDPHVGHTATPAAPVGSEAPPPVPTDHAADRVFGSEVMAAAREQLRREHGVMTWATFRLETAEYRPAERGDAYAWEGEFSYGGDINRFVLKSEGEGHQGDLEAAEVQALYSRAIGPYFNARAGIRQDLEPSPRRTYAAVGVEGVAPYWFEVEATAFLSDKGDLSARVEGSYDLRLTQRLILEPRAEANLAFGDDRAIGIGSGLTDIELGLRLRYAITPEFAPYVGVNWERALGETADLARAAGEPRSDARLAIGVRAWF
ncbi:MAG: copper resistance protein B [Pseudomonadota bacterium]